MRTLRVSILCRLSLQCQCSYRLFLMLVCVRAYCGILIALKKMDTSRSYLGVFAAASVLNTNEFLFCFSGVEHQTLLINSNLQTQRGTHHMTSCQQSLFMTSTPLLLSLYLRPIHRTEWILLLNFGGEMYNPASR